MRAMNKSPDNNKVEVEQAFGKPDIKIPDEVIERQTRWIVDNAWGMLSNQYRELRQRKFQGFSTKGIRNLDSLYAAIVAQWCQALAKEGLYKGYVQHEDEEMQQPQGQINVAQTIQQQTLIRGQIVCSYDELSDDVYMNHILKGTMQYFLQLDTVQDMVKREIKKQMTPFLGFGEVDIRMMKWKSIRYNNNTIRYKNLLDMCKWVVEEKRYSKQATLNDQLRVYLLFKKCLYGILQQMFGEDDNVTQFNMPFEYENELAYELDMFKEQPIVAVSMKDLTLLYMVRLQDTKYYNKDFYMPRRKIQELTTAAKKYEDMFKDRTVGVVLQINLNNGDYNVDNMNVSMLDDHMIGELQVDLWDKWRFVETRLKGPYDYFIGRKKEKLKKN